MIEDAKARNLTIKLRHAKILFCGASRAGKTNFSNFLRGIPFAENSGSTGFAESNQVLKVSNKIKIAEDDWINLDSDEMQRKYLLQQLTKQLESTKDTMKSSVIPAQKSVTKTKFTARKEITTANQTDFAKDPKGSRSNTIVRTNTDPLTHQHKMFNSPKQDLPVDSCLEYVETMDFLTLLDTGGQPEYINLLPAINANTAVSFVVLNLAVGLKEKVKPEHSNAAYNRPDMNYDYLHLLNCLMSTIKESSHRDVKLPDIITKSEYKIPQKAVCFVGTHLDIIKDHHIKSAGHLKGEELTEKFINEINKQISDLINCINIDKKLFVCIYKGKKIIAIDNKNTEDLGKKKLFRDLVSEALPERPLEIPITWCMLEIELITLYKDKQMSCVKLADIEKMVSKYLTLSELKEALRFYHILGVLLYFDKVMDEYVIIDSQWLFNNLTNIITSTFASKEILMDDTILNKFKNQGLFNESLLNKITLNTECMEKKKFLQLLEHLKIIAYIEEDDQDFYFMPCILPSCNIPQSCSISEINETYFPEEDYGYHNFKLKDECIMVKPLLIQFTFGTIPRGFLCYLVVQLLSDNRNYFIYGENEDTKLYRCADMITLKRLPHHYFSILDRISYLEIQVRVEDDSCLSFHFEVQTALTKSLNHICKDFGWKFSDLRYGFLCEKCSANHLAKLSEKEPCPSTLPQYAYCERPKARATELKSGHRIWFIKVCCQGSTIVIITTVNCRIYLKITLQVVLGKIKVSKIR